MNERWRERSTGDRRAKNNRWKDVLGAFDTIVLGQTRFVEVERLCLQCSTILPTQRVGVGTGERWLAIQSNT